MRAPGWREYDVFALDPHHHELDQPAEFRWLQRSPSRDSVPFEDAFSAAGRGRVLSHEYGVAAHRCLPAVVGCRGIADPAGKKRMGMIARTGFAQPVQDFMVTFRQSKSTSECRLAEPRQGVGHAGNGQPTASSPLAVPGDGVDFRRSTLWISEMATPMSYESDRSPVVSPMSLGLRLDTKKPPV